MMRPFGNIEKVRGHSAHKLADLCVVKKGEGQRLNVVKHILAHCVFNLCAHYVAEIRLAVVGNAVKPAERYVGGADAR